MTDARVFKVRNRLRQKMQTRPGKPSAALIESAGIKVDAAKAALLKRADRSIQTLENLAASMPLAQNIETQTEMRAIANDLFSIADAYGLDGLLRLTDGLLNLLRMSPKSPSAHRKAIRAHIAPMRLFLHAAPEDDGEHQILDMLSQLHRAD
ncbi:MAG: hypothetical protein AAF719_01815 [Pseudomonadota bacterium]